MAHHLQLMLARLQKAGYQSQTFDLNLMRQGVHEGWVADGQARETMTLLAAELVANDVEGLGSGPVFESPASSSFSRPQSVHAVNPREFEGITTMLSQQFSDLARCFPVAAHAFHPWVQDAVREMGRVHASISAGVQRGALTRAHMVSAVLHAEYEWQRHGEDQFWNGIHLAVLKALEPESGELELLLRAHGFLGGVLRKSRDGEMVGGEREALKIQLPLMGAMLLARLQEHGVMPAIREVGFKVVAESGAGRVQTVAPEYSMLDRPLLTKVPMDAAALVSLPVTAEMVDGALWRRLQQSPFFLPHAHRLLPSNRFWGMELPWAASLSEIAAMVFDELQGGVSTFSREELAHAFGIAFEDDLLFVQDGDGKMREPAVFGVRRTPLAENTGYRLAISEYDATGECGMAPIVRLNLEIGDHQGDFARITDASYTIGGTITAQVTADRILTLSSRAQANILPIVPLNMMLLRS